MALLQRGLDSGPPHHWCNFSQELAIVPPRTLTPSNTDSESETNSDSDIVAFVQRRFGIYPDERQIEVLTSQSKRGILNCTRQWGKSTIIAAKAVHRAYTQPNIIVLVASPSYRQSSEFLRKSAQLVRKLGIKARGDGSNAVSLLFPNGSRIVGLPGTEITGRGFSSVSMMLIDEAARVPDDMYKMVRPMLAVSEGDLWLMSTPCGKRGFFYESWEHGGPDWHRISVPATECSRIPESFLQEERTYNGGTYFDQEYMCQFTEDGADIFARSVVEAALDDSLSPLNHSGPFHMRDK